MAEYRVEGYSRGSGEKIMGVGSTTIPAYSLVYLNGVGQWALADASTTATMPASGLTIEGFPGSGLRGLVLLRGLVNNSDWSWTPGGEIYASDTAGALSQVAGTIEQQVGIAESATLVNFYPLVITTGLTPGPHAASHEPGGADEVNDIDILSTGVNLCTHATRHENVGGDEINVAGLSGLLADSQTPLTHKASHVVAGTDAFMGGDLLNATARVGVSRNSGAVVGTRRELNFIEGNNISLTVTDDAANEKIDITITGAGAIGRYAEAHISGGGAITVDTQNEWHAVTGFTSDNASGITFNAGSTGAITAYADAGGGQVTVTSAGHGLSTGDIITITGSTNYNDIFEISNVGVNDFEITAVWAGNDGAGTWRNGSNFVIVAAAVYLLTWQISGQAALNNKIFRFTISVNDTAITEGMQRRKFATGGDVGSISGSFVADVSVGDIIAFNLANETDATNITIGQATMNIHRIS